MSNRNSDTKGEDKSSILSLGVGWGVASGTYPETVMNCTDRLRRREERF